MRWFRITRALVETVMADTAAEYSVWSVLTVVWTLVPMVDSRRNTHSCM